MSSRAAATTSHDEPQEQHGEEATKDLAGLKKKLNLLKKKIKDERKESIKEKLKRNEKTIQCNVSTISLTIFKRDSLQTEENTIPMLSSRIHQPLCKFNGFSQGLGEKEDIHHVSPATIINIPYIERLPRYTSWIYVARNEKMAEDQSVIGRIQMYYDKKEKETLIISDSDEELQKPKEAKHDFSQEESQLIWMAFEEHGLNKDVMTIVKKFVGGDISEIQDMYQHLKEENMRRLNQNYEYSEESESNFGICLEKGLSASLDTFDNLFCRQCLQVYDCPLHGCSQPLIYPSEKRLVLSEPEVDKKPCSDMCYLQAEINKVVEEVNGLLLAPSNAKDPSDQSNKAILQKERHNYVTTSFTTDVDFHKDLNSDVHVLKGSTCDDGEHDKGFAQGQKYVTKGIEFELEKLSNPMEVQVDGMLSISDWKPLEKELYLKGVEIFGRNSCLISRNLLYGLKTCTEVASYMHAGEVSMARRSILSSIMGKNEQMDVEGKDLKMPSRSRHLRKKGKAKKFRYSSKSAGLPSMQRRIANGKNQTYIQYTPCGCPGMCGKECPCIHNGSCCEKYCGCSRPCRNRFRGCHCAKGQCRNRQCPCFAAERECDPDVCRNCWVSCGDGSLGESSRRADSQCGNMNFLLRQKQRILLAKSDVDGWGAFIKNTVNKNDFLGEYTGELISHLEADKRGKFYKSIETSYVFNLNDQFAVDAYHQGTKLKFANHSPTPNCYAKVHLVAGDHRVGIFAKERIEAGEEIFYDYNYNPDVSPIWARKDNGSSRGELKVSRGRAKKHPSY